VHRGGDCPLFRRALETPHKITPNKLLLKVENRACAVALSQLHSEGVFGFSGARQIV
jgi:hypothetical protein